MIKFSSLMFLLLVWSPLSIAQSAAPAPRGKDKLSVKKRYNKSTQITTIETETKKIRGPRVPAGDARLSGFGLSLMASYTYPGKTPLKPESVKLTFISAELSAVFDQKRDLTITADGELFRLGKMNYQSFPFPTGHVDEKLSVAISTDVFMRISGAKKVHVQIGEESFDLSEKHLKNLRELTAAMIQQ